MNVIQSDQELFRAHLLHRYSDNSTLLSLRHELPFEEIRFSVACGEIIVWEERMTRYVDVIAAIAAIARRNASVTLQWNIQVRGGTITLSRKRDADGSHRFTFTTFQDFLASVLDREIIDYFQNRFNFLLLIGENSEKGKVSIKIHPLI